MNIVLITSVIHHPRKFANVASIVSDADRFEQTKSTIESVRNHFSAAGEETKIVFVECSPLSEEETSFLQSRVHYFSNIYHDKPDLCKRILNSGSKSMGEGTMTLYALETIILPLLTQVKNMFKISGRYSLVDEFHYSLWDNDKIVVKSLDSPKFNIFTFFYKLPRKYVTLWYKYLRSAVADLAMQQGIGYEAIYGAFVKKCETEYGNENCIIVLDDAQPMGIRGTFAPCGKPCVI